MPSAGAELWAPKPARRAAQVSGPPHADALAMLRFPSPWKESPAPGCRLLLLLLLLLLPPSTLLPFLPSTVVCLGNAPGPHLRASVSGILATSVNEVGMRVASSCCLDMCPSASLDRRALSFSVCSNARLLFGWLRACNRIRQGARSAKLQSECRTFLLATPRYALIEQKSEQHSTDSSS